MKQIILSLIFVVTISAAAQNTISGTFSPAKEYSWLIAYRLKSGTQVYAADTAIKNGAFTLNLPENSPQGTYRLVYAVPQEEFYFDIIYNGMEDIKLDFNTVSGANFTTSQENILFGTYFDEMNAMEREIISFYTQESQDENTYQKILEEFNNLQESYENKSQGLIVNEFIRANNSSISSQYTSIQDYVQNRKDSYFDNLNMTNPVLQASGFLTDKLTNYVFTALPLEQLEKSETEKEMQKNIITVFKNLDSNSGNYNFHVLYTIWTQSVNSGFNETADFIYLNYLKQSKEAAANKDIIEKIEIYNRLRIGALAPEIIWTNQNQEKKLSTLSGAANYILVFWSSTCGHCLKELPALHKELREVKNTRVIAIGLENNDTSWNIESGKLENFDHAISLGKWDSEYANLYNIQATPTYFILDENKRIIAKPESDKDVVAFLRKQ